MISPSNDITTDTINARALATLIIELNIARRNCHAYPKGHPVIASSLAKVLRVYEELLQKHTALILGITSESLMLDGVIIEKSNLVFRDFSHALFERGIGALLFHRGLTIQELNNFTIILGLKREQIQQHGGIEQVWEKAHITGMTIRPIRYDLFQTTDEDSVAAGPAESGEGLWDRFTRELTRGELPPESDGTACLDPEVLAEMLNQQFARGTLGETNIHTAIADFLASTDEAASSETHSYQPHQKLAAFISNLTPELRRQFLASSFSAKGKERHDATEQILTNLTEKAVLETLEDIKHERLNVSPVIFGLLQRLGQNAGASQNIPEEISEEEALTRKMKTIFREHASEEFVPDDYQKKINHIIASDRIPRLNMEEVTDLLHTIENHSIESSIGHILMNLVREGAETPEQRDLLLQNLSDMFGYFLQTGDYGQLHTIIDQLTDGTVPIDIQNRLQDEYGRREFLEEILDGLAIWGKPRYGDIRSLIRKIGGQFVEAILDRLSEENNMSLRRFYMDCLIEMGPATRVPISNRLSDNRWYFIRNLLIILTAQNDPSVVPLIRPLLRKQDPRLHQEVLKTLLHFGDPQTEKLILGDLESKNAEKQAAAILLAERCSSLPIVSKLTTLITVGGFSQIECERKSAVIHALGEIGRGEAMPSLVNVLHSRSLLHSRQLNKLKADIIRSLPKYPSKISLHVLERIAGGSGEIARLAATTLQAISRKPV